MIVLDVNGPVSLLHLPIKIRLSFDQLRHIGDIDLNCKPAWFCLRGNSDGIVEAFGVLAVDGDCGDEGSVVVVLDVEVRGYFFWLFFLFLAEGFLFDAGLEYYGVLHVFEISLGDFFIELDNGEAVVEVPLFEIPPDKDLIQLLVDIFNQFAVELTLFEHRVRQKMVVFEHLLDVFGNVVGIHVIEGVVSWYEIESWVSVDLEDSW